MLAILWEVFGGWRSALVAAAAVALTLSAASLYDRTIDDPAVAASARRDYVVRSELDAAKAQAALEQGRRLAAEAASAAHARKEADELAADALYTERLEQRIADNEKLLAAQGRACLLDDADVDFVRNNDRAKASGRR